MATLQGLVEALGRLGWLREPSVPVIGCRGGATACWRMRGDYWLAGRFEKSILGQLFHRVYGAKLPASERLVVLHRVPAPLGEYAAEAFVDALRLGVVEYAPGRGWLLHPSGASASLAEALGASVVEAPPRLRGRLKGKRLRLDIARTDGWVIVASGGWVGPARVIEPGTVKVKDMAPRGMKPLEPASVEEAIEANAEVVGALAAEARSFIRRVSERAGPRVYVAFSGGADSTAVLSLAREALGAERIVAVYVDTGMEFPETKRHVERIASMLEVDLEWVEAGRDPLDEVRKHGLMTRDNRWCTRLLKLEPLRRFYSSRGARLVLDGARMWESSSRAKTPRIGRNPLIPGVTRALPIRHWSRLAVQLYLAERGLPVLHLYQEGLTRIGCIACPAMHLYELHLAYRLHQWWFRMLSEAARLPLAELLRGTWRKPGEAATWIEESRGEKQPEHKTARGRNG